MKSYQIVLLIVLSLFVYSCSDNLTNVGSGIQPASDQITVGTDTFHVSTENVLVDYINSRPDSFLLGTFNDAKFGSTQADILAQVNCPEGFKFPPLSTPDSAVVVMYYKTWFGSKYSPLEVKLYEMTKNTFDYSSLYPSNLDPTIYTDLSKPLASRIFSAKDAVKLRSDSTAIRFKLSSDFVQRFFDASHYSSTSTFLNFFKGIYITAGYGAATLLNVEQIDLHYYYNYKYTTQDIHGNDSIGTRNTYLIFPANSEVRQVNRFLHNDRATVVQQRDSVNYIATPANLQTRVNIPLNRISQHMKKGVNGKTPLTVNSALLKVEVTETELDTALHPVVKYLLLMKESAKSRFFNNRELPSDTCAIRGDYTTAEVGTTGVYKHYYTFNLAKLIVNELKNAEKTGKTPLDKLNMLLVPVKIATATSTSGVVSYTSVKEDYEMSAVTIRSGKNTYSPMRINVVYSGF
jgi:hypothetical protein